MRLLRAVLAVSVLLGVAAGSDAARAVDAINVRVEAPAIDLIDAVEILKSEGDRIQVSTAPGTDGIVRRIEVRGRKGRLLRDFWTTEGPKTYLGLQIAGFPNLFTITGPGSPSVLANMVLAIEQHVEWIGRCLDYFVDRIFGIGGVQPAGASISFHPSSPVLFESVTL